MISIIIRTKNEERWIGHCLKQIQKQSYKDYEVVLVDNNSTDFTVEKAKSIMPEIVLCNIEEFKPGKAINLGIKKSKGEFIVCLSAHCIPVDEYWLENLHKEIIADEKIAGVYGRQLPMDQTHDIDRRDMYITFGLDKKVQYKDPFFHNANSILKKSLWQEVSFDEDELNIEDRIWGQMMIDRGYKLVYTPNSMVYHMHGIHQTNKNKRYKNIARIIEETSNKINTIPLEEYSICAIIPILESELKEELSCRVFLDTLALIENISHFSYIVITTDNKERVISFLASVNIENAYIIHERNYEKRRLLDVYPIVLEFLKVKNIFPDIVFTTDISYPVKTKEIFESCLYELLKNDVEAVIPAYTQKRPTWIKRDEDYERVDSYEVEKEDREPVYIGLENICTVTYSNKIDGFEHFFDNKIEMVIVDSPCFKFHINDIKNINDYKYLKKIAGEKNEL